MWELADWHTSTRHRCARMINVSEPSLWSQTAWYSCMMGSRFHRRTSTRQPPTFLQHQYFHRCYAVSLKMCEEESRLRTPSWLMLRIQLLGALLHCQEADDKSWRTTALHFLHVSECLRLHTWASDLISNTEVIKCIIMCDRINLLPST